MVTKVTVDDTPQGDDLARAEEALTRSLQRSGQNVNTGHDDQYRQLSEHDHITVRPRANTQREQWTDMDGQNGGGRDSSKGFHRASVSELRPDSTGSVLDTLRTKYGDPKPVSQATADDQVIVDGMEISLGVAEQLGLVAKDANGNWYDPKVGVPGTDHFYRQVEQHREEKAERAENSTANALRSVDSSHSAYLGDDAEQTLATLVRSDASLAGDLVSSAINALSQGEQPSIDYNAIAAALGKQGNTAAGQAAVAKVATALNEQAYDIFMSAGAYDTEQALEWARKTMPTQFRDAIAKQIEGDISGLENLAHQYAQSGANTMPTDPDMPDPTTLSDEELMEELKPNLPEGGKVYLKGHVAYYSGPGLDGFDEVPLRTLVETGHIYWS